MAFAPSASATEILRKQGFKSAATVQKLLADLELQRLASGVTESAGSFRWRVVTVTGSPASAAASRCPPESPAPSVVPGLAA
jgi:hypothetical protein